MPAQLEVAPGRAGHFQVWPRPNLRAVSPAGTREAVLLHAEPWDVAHDPSKVGGCTMVWDNWDLRGNHVNSFRCTTTFELDGAAPAVAANVSLRYSMTRGPRGQNRGRITLEADVRGVPNQVLNDLRIALRITVPWARFDTVYAYTVAPGVSRCGKFERRWRIQPHSGIVVVSAIITRGRDPGGNDDWPVTHLLPPL